MKHLMSALPFALALVACSSTPPPPTIAERTTIMETKVKVPVKCIESLPPLPELEQVPRSGSSDQALARIKREEQLANHVNQLRTIAKPCVDLKGDDRAEN